jgi:YVTN family beta-propeller protein
MLRAIALVCFMAITVTAAAGAAATQPYHLAQKYVLGGDGGWDYLTFDPVGKRLFVSRATRVQVIDPYKGVLVTEIPGTQGVHGIALAQDLGKGFTSNGQANTVTVFDLKSLAVTATIAVSGQNPDAIVYESASQRVLTFDGRSDNSTVIDAKTNSSIATLSLGGRPEFAAADGAGMVYDNLEDMSELVAIDARKPAVVATWPLAPCQNPSGMAMDRANRRLFIGCRNQMMAVVDADNGKVITTLPIGKGSDAIGFDPGTDLAFSSNGDGTLTVVHEDSPSRFSVVDNAQTQQYARTLAVDTTDHDVYLVTAQMMPAPSPSPVASPESGSPPPFAGFPRRMPVPGTFTLLVMSQH